MTSKVVVREVPENIECHTKILDAKRFILCTNGLIQGNCVSSSLRTWYKMRNTPAIRVRGKREREIEDDKEQGVNDNYHYWVENKGMCFDLSGGLQQIFKKEDYYEQMRVVVSQEADIGRAFFSDNIKKSENKNKLLKIMESDYHLDNLIKKYEEDEKIKF
jgi:hypothetical protein